MSDETAPRPDGGGTVAETAQSDATTAATTSESDTPEDTTGDQEEHKSPDPAPENLLPAAPSGDDEGESDLAAWTEYWEAIEASPHVATGLKRLDESFDPVGIRPGSIVLVTGRGNSLSGLLTSRLAAHRETIYISFANRGAVIANRLDDLEAIGTQPLHPIEANDIDAPDTLESRLNEVLEEVSGPCTIIVDPVNRVEDMDLPAYREFLRSVKDHVDQLGGIAVFHAIKTDHEPTGRWTTHTMSDLILTVSQSRDGGLSDELELTRIDPVLKQENVSRHFQINTETITLRRPRNISD